MTLSIIIVTYNVSDHLRQCLLSVKQALRNLDGEIIVVDNNSPDYTVTVVRNHFPEIKILANQSNDGFSKACNQGAAAAHGKYLLFLNPDTIIGEGTFEYVLDHLIAHPKVAAAGVKMLDGTGSYLPESKRGIPDSWNSFCKIVGLTKLFPNNHIFSGYHAGYLSKDKEHSVPVLSGAFIMVKAEAFRVVGGFDERFFMYGEDIDFSMALLNGGYMNLYLPKLPILHFKGRSSPKDRDYVMRFYKAMFQFIDKYYDHMYQAPVKALLKLSVYLKRSLALAKVQKQAPSGPEPQTFRRFQFLHGDADSCREYELSPENSLIQVVSDPAHAAEIVLCQGPTFSFGHVIDYIRKNPGKKYCVHAFGVDGIIS